MHLDLIKKRRQKKVKSRLVHRLGDGLDVRDGLTHGYTQQIHVCPWSLVLGLCFPLHAYVCTHAP